MLNKHKVISACIAFLSIQLWSTHAFTDPISVIGRIKWNYTTYEENLWTRRYKNTSLEQIFDDHMEFAKQINQVYETNAQSFYPTLKDAQLLSEHSPVVDAFINNPFNVPFIDSIIYSNAHITEYWWKFANWSSYNATDILDTVIDDAIPLLETSSKDLWNTSSTQIFFDFLQNKSFACVVMDYPEQAVYKLTEKYFTDTIVLQLKAYIMLQLSYLTKASKDFIRYHKLARDLRVKFNSRFSSFTHDSENLVWKLSRVIWSCDNFTQPDSYAQLTNFIQGYIDNEINLNPDGSCAPYCRDFKKTENYKCHPKTFCGSNYLDHNKTRCDGTIRDCDYFEASMTICPNEDDKEPNRRINFVKLQSGRVLGHTTDEFCIESDRYNAKPFSFWLQTCRYCFCYCDAPSLLSHRHFSLREITSNIDENKVISGIRLTKKNGIIHLSAVERSLLPDAQLDTLNSSLISNDSFCVADENAREGVDYHTLTYENRTINLDLITGSRDQVVTGVRYRVHSGALHLEVRFTYFDESTGTLDLTTRSEWKMNSNSIRNTIPTEHLDVPTNSLAQSIAMGSDDKDAVRFVPTGWVRDVAQTTVPFIDSIMIEPPEAVPLAGVGLFYKFQQGHGGYVAPKLYLYDYATTALRVRAAVGVYGV